MANGNEANLFEETMKWKFSRIEKIAWVLFDQYATLQCKEIIKKQEENKKKTLQAQHIKNAKH